MDAREKYPITRNTLAYDRYVVLIEMLDDVIIPICNTDNESSIVV